MIYGINGLPCLIFNDSQDFIKTLDEVMWKMQIIKKIVRIRVKLRKTTEYWGVLWLWGISYL